MNPADRAVLLVILLAVAWWSTHLAVWGLQ